MGITFAFSADVLLIVSRRFHRRDHIHKLLTYKTNELHAAMWPKPAYWMQDDTCETPLPVVSFHAGS